MKNVKRNRLFNGVLLIIVAGVLLLSSIIALDIMFPNQSTASEQASSPNMLNNGIHFAGPITFELMGSNVAELTVAAGSEVQGAISIKINGTFSFQFYHDDLGFNTTKSTLPEGISVSINVYGKNYDVLPVTSLLGDPTFMAAVYPNQSPIQLVPTTRGETTVKYTVRAASNVPAGVYNIRIVFQSVTDDGELYGFEKGTLHYGYAEGFGVILHVQ